MARSVQQTQRQLIACALEVLADEGFDTGFFTECLRGAHSISLTQVAAYGITASQLHAIQRRFSSWADDIDNKRND